MPTRQESEPRLRTARPLTLSRSADPTDRFRASDVPHTHPLFVEAAGTTTGRVHAIPEGVFTLGRSEDCTFRFDDPTLSRVHARVHRSGYHVVLEDAGSLNGTVVNGVRADRRQLRNGDRIRLGAETTLRFQLASAKEERSLTALYESAVRDGLTLLYNRAYLTNYLAAELSYARRHATPVSVVLLDADRFKLVNDTYGHLAGDAVLRELAAVALRTVRREDVVARFGGEELCIVARGIDLASAGILAERLRAAVEAHAIVFGEQRLGVTISAGVASTEEPGLAIAPEILLARADGRLYQAKESGRNRVVVHGIPSLGSARARTRRLPEE